MDFLPISTENLYVPLGDVENFDIIAKKGIAPILALTYDVYSEVVYISNKLAHSEYALFLTTKKIDDKRPHFVAFDWVMPIQEASSGGVDILVKDMCELYDELSKDEFYQTNGLHRSLTHLHSHASMGVFWSSTDEEQQMSHNDLGFLDDYRLYVVTNAAGKFKCTLVVYKPTLVRVDAYLAIYTEGGSRLTKGWREEIDDTIAKNVKTVIPAVTEFGGTINPSARYYKNFNDNNFDYYKNFNDNFDYASISNNDTFKKFIQDEVVNVGANNVDANNVDANNVGANNVDANNVDANNVGANNVGANNVGANNVNVIATNNVDANNVDVIAKIKKLAKFIKENKIVKYDIEVENFVPAFMRGIGIPLKEKDDIFIIFKYIIYNMHPMTLNIADVASIGKYILNYCKENINEEVNMEYLDDLCEEIHNEF